MTKHTHTPGPWHVGGKFDSIVYDADGCAIANATTYHGKHADRAASENARLIAAAPDLLAALRDMVANYVDTYGDEGDDAPATVKAALAAIAKAEG